MPTSPNTQPWCEFLAILAFLASTHEGRRPASWFLHNLIIPLTEHGQHTHFIASW